MLRKFGKMGLGASVGKSIPIEVLPKTKPMTFEIITRPYVLGLFEATVELYKGTFEDIPGADYSNMEVVSEELVATQQLQAYPNYAPITFQIPYDDDYEVYFIKIKNFAPAPAFSDIKCSIDEWCLNTHNYPRFGIDADGNNIKKHSAYNRLFELTRAVYYETVYKVLDENGELITDRKYVGFYSTRKNDSNSIYFFDKEDDLEKVEHNVPGELMLCREYHVEDSSKTPYDITKVTIRKYKEPIAEDDMYWSGSSLPKEYESQMTVYAPPGYTYEVKYSANNRLDFEAPTSVLIPPSTTD